MASNTMDPRRRDKRPGETDPLARREPAGQEPAPLRSRPANENDPGTSLMLAKLRHSPSFAPYYVAFALSLGWVAGWFFVFSNTVIAVPDPFGPQRLAETMRALALLVLPIGIVWVTAYFLWRAAQLRQVSEVLMQSAMRLIRPQDIATEGLTSIAQAVRSEVDLLVGGVEHAMQRAAVLEEIVHKEISAIERAFGGNEERIRGLVAGLENQRAALHQASMVLASEANPVLARLESNTQNLGGIIVNAQSTLVQLEQGLRESSSGLARTIDEVATRAANATGQIGTQTGQMERVSNMLTGQLNDFSRQLQDQIQTLSRAAGLLNSESVNFGQTVHDMESSVVQLLGQSVDQLTGINREIGLTIERVSADSAGQIKQAAEGLAEVIQGTGSNITYHLNATSNEVASLIERSGVDVSQQIEQSRNLVNQGLEQVASTYLGRITEAQDNFAGLLDRATTGATRELQSAGSSLNELLVTTSGTIAAHLKETSGIVGRQMQESGLALAQNIEGSGGLVTDRLITVSGEFVQNLSRARDDLFALLDSSANEMTSRLDRTATDMTAQLESSATRIHDHIGTTAGGVATQVVQATDKLAAQLDYTASGITKLFAVNTGRMTAELQKTSAEIATQLDAAGSTMFARLETTARDLGKAGDALSQGLGETTLQITGHFEQNTGLLVGRIDQAARELDSAAAATSNKLEDAHRKFSKHVETANLYLADQLAGAAGALDEKLEGISMQLTGKLEMSGTRLSERLEDVSMLVEKSLDKFNGDMERVLVNRREALDQLSADANRKAQEIDTVMTGYMKLIEESLAASETRSKDIGRIVTEQTAAAAANLEQEIKKLEASSGGQIGQAARILREQHERAMASMNEMLSATASDFQQTAQDMRITAQQVVKDIDTARGELKRAILDLPEETRSNADAMRRVVADQIAALNTLAEVVKRQTGTLDATGPGVMLPRAVRDMGAGKSDSAALSAPARGRERNEAAESSIARSMAVLLPRPARQPESALEPAAIPRDMENLVQKLNAAARDLVEAVDGTLPRDLEKSFNAGERGVYTHRLFEARGKRFVKTIEDRYGSERLVRGRVDAYVRLFERLLDTVSEAPQGASMVEACLASESGKLYVTLAEAAGRIPPQ